MRRAALTLLMIPFALGPGQAGLAQRAGGPPPGAPTRLAPRAGEITGRVLSAAGSPLRAAQVQARSAAGGTLHSTWTDAEGRFALRDLAAGRWSVTASKAGFIPMQAGQRDPRQVVAPVQLTGNGPLTVDFVLGRGAAVSGTVYDEYGDPLAGAIVSVMSARGSQNRFVPLAGRSDRSDDTGAFRIHSLPPGSYVVTAERPASSPDEPGGGGPIGRTYFPGTPSPAVADRIMLRLGEERSGLAFAVTPSRAVRVSGVVVDSAGTPVEGADADLRNAWDNSLVASPFGNFGLTHPGGRFAFLNVPPGEYVLTARVTRPGAEPETGVAAVSVGSENMADVVMSTQKPASIDGVVVAEPGMQLPASFPAAISARPLRPGTDPREAVTDRTGRFTLTGLHGQVTLAVRNLSEGWFLKSVELDGIDATDSTVEIPPGRRSSARVIVSNRSARVTGTLDAPQGSTQGAYVVVFPADRVPRNLSSRFVRVLRHDGAGPFSVTSLPPREDYLAIAVDYLDDEGATVDAEFLESVRARAIPFSVGERETRVLTLTVVNR